MFHFLVSIALIASISPISSTISTTLCDAYSDEIINDSAEKNHYEEPEALLKDGYSSESYSTVGSTLPVVEYDYTTKSLTTMDISYSESGYASTPSKYIKGENGYYTFSPKNCNTINSVKDNLVATDYADRSYSMLSSIGQLSTISGGKTYYGSCFTVASNLILTAAHCLYENKQFASSPIAWFDLYEITQENGKRVNRWSDQATIEKVIMPKAYYDCDDADSNIGKDNDWCICVLKYDIGNEFGYLSIASGYTMANCYNFACGYPVDVSDSRKSQLCYSAAFETNVKYPSSKNVFSLNNYVLGGMSGGPEIFYYEDAMTFEQYEGVSSILTRRSDLDGHGYSVKVTNQMIETLKEAQRL